MLQRAQRPGIRYVEKEGYHPCSPELALGEVSELFSLAAPLGSRCIFPLHGSHWRLVLVQPVLAKQKVMA